MTYGKPRYVSNDDLARMQARYANQGGAMSNTDTGAGIKRRQRDNSAVKDLAAEVHQKVTDAIDIAETTMRREERLKAAGRRRRSNGAR